MSFDIFFQPCRSGTGLVERENPLTGEMQTGAPVEPLSDEEVRAIRGVLAASGSHGPDEFGCYVIDLADGGDAEVYGGDPETGVMVALRSLTPNLLRFLFNLLEAADWVMLPAMEGNPAIVSSPGLARGFADGFPEVVCGSPEELGAILSGGYDAWDTYRNQIVGEGRPQESGDQ